MADPHGSGVDGVKYFNTDRSGNALTGMRGILSESAATNLMPNSIDMENLTLNENITVNVGSVDSIYSHQTRSMVPTSVNGEHRFRSASSQSLATEYTSWAVVKEASGAISPWVKLRANGNDAVASFNLDTLATNSAGTTSSKSIKALVDGWFRISMTYTPLVVSNNKHSLQALNASQGSSFTGDDVQEHFHCLHWQVEVNGFASSAIKTIGDATATRTADDASVPVTGITDKLSASVQIYNEKTIAGTAQVLYISDGTVNNAISLSLEDGKPRLIVTVGGATQADITAAAAITLDQINTLVITAEANSFELFVNSVSAGTDGAGTFPSGLNTADIGHENGTNQLEGGIQNIELYPNILVIS